MEFNKDCVSIHTFPISKYSILNERLATDSSVCVCVISCYKEFDLKHFGQHEKLINELKTA